MEGGLTACGGCVGGGLGVGGRCGAGSGGLGGGGRGGGLRGELEGFVTTDWKDVMSDKIWMSAKVGPGTRDQAPRVGQKDDELGSKRARLTFRQPSPSTCLRSHQQTRSRMHRLVLTIWYASRPRGLLHDPRWTSLGGRVRKVAPPSVRGGLSSKRLRRSRHQRPRGRCLCGWRWCGCVAHVAERARGRAGGGC